MTPDGSIAQDYHSCQVILIERHYIEKFKEICRANRFMWSYNQLETRLAQFTVPETSDVTSHSDDVTSDLYQEYIKILKNMYHASRVKKGEMKMSIYATLLQKAKDGGNYKINLKTKTLQIGRKDYVKEGVVLIEDDLICNEDFETFNILVGDVQNMSWKNVVWHLYNIFNYSVPNKHYKSQSYFKAKEVEELGLADMACGVDRKLAQAQLEGYILLGSLAEWIKWEDDGKWFWQDATKQLIVLREWIQK